MWGEHWHIDWKPSMSLHKVQPPYISWCHAMNGLSSLITYSKPQLEIKLICTLLHPCLWACIAQSALSVPWLKQASHCASVLKYSSNSSCTKILSNCQLSCHYFHMMGSKAHQTSSGAPLVDRGLWRSEKKVSIYCTASKCTKHCTLFQNRTFCPRFIFKLNQNDSG